MNPMSELLSLIDRRQRSLLSIGTVKSFDAEEWTCEVEREDLATLYNVRLNSIIGGNDLLQIKPAVGSYVLCCDLADGGSIVLALSDIESVSLTIGDTSVLIDSSGCVFDKGHNCGLVKVNDVVDKLNILEESLNALKQIMNNWIPVPQDGGAALKAELTGWSAKVLTKTQREDIENKRIQQ